MHALSKANETQTKGDQEMKKLSIAFVTVLMVAGLAVSAFANPGWEDGRRYNDRGRPDRFHSQYDDRDFRGQYRHPVVAHRAPVFPPRYGMRAHLPPPPPPIFSFFLPPFIIPIR
jgi:hypothetical protein